MDHAEYDGPLDALKGKTALVRPDETYGEPDIAKRTLLAQFDEIGLLHPTTGVRLSEYWHTFAVTDFKILVVVEC